MGGGAKENLQLIYAVNKRENVFPHLKKKKGGNIILGGDWDIGGEKGNRKGELEMERGSAVEATTPLS